MEIKYRIHRPWLDADMVAEKVREVVKTGWIGEGPKVVEFEKEISKIIDNSSLVALNSCTSALTMAYHLADVGPGSIIITTPFTCTATNIPAITLGAKIVFADIDSATGNIDTKSVERKIRRLPKVRAIVFVDWGGGPPNHAHLADIARVHGCKLIEDGAHAIGGLYRGEPIGNGKHVDYTCFSFQAIKHITTADGGALALRNPDELARTKNLRWFGIPRDRREDDILGHSKYDIGEAGFKWHMNDVAATIGLVSLKSFRKGMERRLENARIYRSKLAAVPGIQVPQESHMGRSAYWLFPVLVDNVMAFSKHMRSNGVEVSNTHVRNDVYTIFRQFTSGGLLPREDYPGLWEYSERMTCLPVGPWILEEDVEYICDVIKRGW